MLVVIFPRGTGWYLTYDQFDRVIGAHWTQTQDASRATRFATLDAAQTALAGYYGDADTARIRWSSYTVLPETVLKLPCT